MSNCYPISTSGSNTHVIKEPLKPGMDSLGMDSQGFTFIEVLITVVILGVGLLGLAAMESISVRRSHDAYLRSQAIMQAQEMADRMHANPAGVAAGGYNNIGATIVSPPTCLDRTSTTVAAAASTDCSPAQIANFDANEWLIANANLLPSGSGTVTVSSGIYTITLNWTETESAGATAKSFAFQFRPLP